MPTNGYINFAENSVIFLSNFNNIFIYELKRAVARSGALEIYRICPKVGVTVLRACASDLEPL